MKSEPCVPAVPSHAVAPRSRTLVRRTSAVLMVGALALVACSSDGDTVSTDTEAEQVIAGQDADAEAIDAVDPNAVQQNGPVEVEGAILGPFESTGQDFGIGTTAPVVRGEGFDGEEIVIGGPTDNPTMIVFLAHWCPHCNAEIPVLLQLEADGQLPENLDVIGVSTAVDGDRENFPPSQWIDEKGWLWPTMADDQSLTAFGAFGGLGFPFTVVLDTDGTVLARRSGEATGEATIAFLEAAFANASA